MRLVAKVVIMLVVPVMVLGLLLSPMVDHASAEYQPTLGWTKYTGEIDLDDEIAVADAWVIKDGDTYRMWYTRLRLDESFADIADRITALNGPAIADAFINVQLGDLLNLLAGLNAADVMTFLDSVTTVIGYATSTDGKDWTIENSEVLAGGSSLQNGVGTPCVIKDGDTYKMWYSRFEVDWGQTELAAILTGLGGTPTEQQTAVENFLDQTRSVIGYATSDDLDAGWTVQNAQVFPAADGTILDSVGAPCVIKESDTDYKMWYTGVKSDLTLSELAAALTDTGSFDLSAALNLLDGSSSFIGYTESADGTTWSAGSEVLSGSGPIWESIGDPCVVKANEVYEMWYTRSSTDLTIDDMGNLLDEIKLLDLSGLWQTLDDNGIADFLTAYLAKDLTTINGLISNTNSVIAYATSLDGTTWTVQKESDLTGSSSNLWSSVGAPCVIGNGASYTMWFTKGIGTLDFQSLSDLIFGVKSTIGQATYPPGGGGGGGGGVAPPPPGTTSLIGKVDEDGYLTEDVMASSEDGLAWVTIPEGTKGLDEFGYPLPIITIVEMEDPPDPPTDHSVIGVVYDFGPDGATFDPPVTLTITYNPESLPEGVEEEDLTIAVWDEDAGAWIKLPSVVDTENKTISAQIDGFSGFAILVSHRPASFEIGNLSIAPGQVEVGQRVTITLTISNSGDLSGAYQLELLINGILADAQDVTLGGGESTTVSFEITKSAAGIYTVIIGDLSGAFIVEEEIVEPEPEPEPEPEADIITSSLTATPAAVRVGETVTVNILVNNRGDGEGSYELVLVIDGEVAESRTVTLTGNSEQTETFTVIAETTGVHTVEVDDLSTIFVVLERPEEPEEPSHLNWWLIGGIIGGCAVLTAAAAIFLLRRRMV